MVTDLEVEENSPLGVPTPIFFSPFFFFSRKLCYNKPGSQLQNSPSLHDSVLDLSRRQQEAGEMSSWLGIILNDDPLPPLASSIVTIPQAVPQEKALGEIERLLGDITDAITEGWELAIPFRTNRTPRTQQGDILHPDTLRFPGRTIREVNRFRTCLSP